MTAGSTPEPLPIGTLAQLACLLEVTARKPGNVHPERHFEDSHLLDFLLSASAIVDPMEHAQEHGVGRTILDSVRATRRLVSTNTNLGIILLLAPLAATPNSSDLRAGVKRVLESTTIEDSVHCYEAIRLARPGGLGEVDDQDVRNAPTIPLIEAMRLASVRDLIARQYVNVYNEVFTLALPSLRKATRAGYALETTIQGTFLTILATHSDTLILRKRGETIAREATLRARRVLDQGWPDTRGGREAFEEFDAWLREDGHARNPGATADLLTAALFVALRDGTIVLPKHPGPRGWSLPDSDPLDPEGPDVPLSS